MESSSTTTGELRSRLSAPPGNEELTDVELCPGGILFTPVFGALPGRPFRAENGVVVARRCRCSLVRERPYPSRARGAALWALHCCLRARELDSLLSQQLLRATTFGSWITPSGGSHVDRK